MGGGVQLWVSLSKETILSVHFRLRAAAMMEKLSCDDRRLLRLNRFSPSEQIHTQTDDNR